MSGASPDPVGGSGDVSPASGDAAHTPHDEVEERVDPKPLAAYRLGYLSFGVWFWHEVSWKFAEEWSIRDRTRSAIAELRDAMNALYSEIHPNLFSELVRAVTELDVKTGHTTDPSRPSPDTGPDAYRNKIAPYRSEWEAVKALADQALNVTRDLRRLYVFGSSLGELRLKLWDWGPGSVFDPEDLERYHRWIDAGGEDPLPDMRPLVRSAMRLPQGVVGQIPYVETLITLAPLLESTERANFLKTFLRRHAELSPLFEVAEQVDHAIVSAMVDALDRAVEARLGASAADVKSPLPLNEQTALSWDRVSGELRFGTKVIRTYAGQASTARVVLDRFQSLDWPKTIPNPFNEPVYPERLRSAERSLNRHLCIIKFKVSGTSMSWEWAAEG